MKREWQPGDVAMVSTPKGERRAVRAHGGWDDFEGAWWDDFRHLPARPLLLIDPEDREQVERLADEIVRLGAANPVSHRHLADALRESVGEKPKPCPARIALGKEGALYHCDQPADHDGPHVDGSSFVWMFWGASP